MAEQVNKKKLGKKIWIPIVAAIAIIGIIFAIIKFAGGSNGRLVYIMPVSDISTSGNSMGSMNRFSGVVEPQETKDIQLDSSKTLDEVFVKVGDEVKVGDQLFKYDIANMNFDLQQLGISVQQANNNIVQIQNDIQDLKNSGADTYTIQIRQMDLSDQYAEITKLQNQIEEKKREIAQAVVTSPIDGVIKSINNPDSYSFSGNNAYMTIIAQGEFLIKAKISEMNIHEISVGSPVIVRSRVNETQTWPGVVTSLDTSNQSDNQNEYYGGGETEGATKYVFYVGLENTDGLMLGQHVTIENGLDTSGNYSGVLLNAGYIADLENSAYVWKDNNGRITKSFVQLGKYNENTGEYEVLSGLTLDDMIAFPDDQIEEGMKTTTEYVYEENNEEFENYEQFEETNPEFDGSENMENGELDGAVNEEISNEELEGAVNEEVEGANE